MSDEACVRVLYGDNANRSNEYGEPDPGVQIGSGTDPTEKRPGSAPVMSFFLDWVTRVVFVFFLVTMSIVLMNLVVGLAIGDIESMRKA